MNLSYALLTLLVFPGLLYGLPMGWLMLGLERKLRARFQGRIGPPLSQPFYDVIKLLAKSPVPRMAWEKRLLAALPLVSLGAMAGALALLPVGAGESGFFGDLILLVALLEMPSLCLILAGYTSRSIYGEVGATREALVNVTCSVPFLMALVAMATAAGSLHISRIVAATPLPVRVPALLAILICLPVKLRLNPFSLANAEQELLAGPLTEFDGPRLALWDLAHALEWVALTGFVVALSVPLRSPRTLVNGFAFALLSLALVPVLTVLASATARLKITQATRLLWRWGSAVALIALTFAVFDQGGR